MRDAIFLETINSTIKNHGTELLVTSGESVSMTEFEKAAPILKERGLKVPNAQVIFNKIDTNNGGYILFDEFCHYAIENEMEFKE